MNSDPLVVVRSAITFPNGILVQLIVISLDDKNRKFTETGETICELNTVSVFECYEGGMDSTILTALQWSN